MDEPFATIDDLEIRWRELLPSEIPKAEILLSDASDQLRTLFPDIDERIKKGKTKSGIVKSVVCAMVKRAMQEPDEMFGGSVSAFGQSVGSASENYTFRNPDGDLFIKKSEIKALGYGSQFVAGVDLGGIRRRCVTEVLQSND
jgi:hypothetical protein